VEVKEPRKNFRGSYSCIVKVTRPYAKALLEKKRITVGWNGRCRVYELVNVNVCYKCLAPGHLAATCTEKNVAKRCYNCGSSEHLAKECDSRELRCFHCNEEGHRANTMG